jgi:hypothetical protein
MGHVEDSQLVMGHLEDFTLPENGHVEDSQLVMNHLEDFTLPGNGSS